jgi:hypothetical protein
MHIQREDKIRSRNYITIMINVVFPKIIGGIMEKRVNTWVEENDKRVEGKGDFLLKHSIIVHCLTLSHIIEKTWDKKDEESWCYFVDFRKAFDIVPMEKLWERLTKMVFPNGWRAMIERLYENVKAKIRAIEGVSNSFNNDIEVKHDFSLSSTLFGLYINKLRNE